MKKWTLTIYNLDGSTYNLNFNTEKQCYTILLDIGEAITQQTAYWVMADQQLLYVRPDFFAHATYARNDK